MANQTKKRTMSFGSGVTMPKKTATNTNGDTLSTDDMKLDTKSSSTAKATYNYGLTKLAENCRIIHIDVNGQKDLDLLCVDDRVLISEFIDQAARTLPQKHDVCDIIIVTDAQTKNEYTLAEYIVVIKMLPDTVVDIGPLTDIQMVNALRCGRRDSIKTYYDRKTDKQCVQMTLTSFKSPVCIGEGTLTHRHYSMIMTTSEGDRADELSVNRKRAKNSSVNYEKICDNSRK